VSPVVLKAMKKGNLKSFVSGERSRALWALLFHHDYGQLARQKIEQF